MNTATSSIILSGLTLSAFFLATPALAQCWRISTDGESEIQVGEIWQIRNRLNEQGALMGRVDGERMALAIEEVRSLHRKPSKESLFGAGSPRFELLDEAGARKTFESDLPLHYLKDGENGRVVLAEVRAAIRCASKEVPAESALNKKAANVANPAAAPAAGAYTLRMRNGDVLHGELADTKIGWKTPYGKLSVKVNDIQSISAKSGGANGVLLLRSGDKIGGALADSHISLRLSIGQSVRLPVGEMESLKSTSPR